jgi:hypothetical protein
MQDSKEYSCIDECIKEFYTLPKTPKIKNKGGDVKVE